MIKLVGENQRRPNKMPFSEKRRYPRVDKKLPLKLEGEKFDVITETENISAAGAYCRIGKYLAPFTMLDISLFLPSKDRAERVDCKGVVVRTEENLDKTYSIAIYFSEIKEVDKKKISQYVNYYLKRRQILY